MILLMRLQRISVFIVSALIIAPVAQAATVRYQLDAPESVLSFEGQSTLHDFTGTIHALAGALAFDPERQTLEAPAEISLPVAGFQTGIAARDKAMQAMFEAERFPDIRIMFTSLTPLDAAPDASLRRHYRLAGQATIRTITQSLECDVWATATSHSIIATGEAHLTTTQFNLHPPSVLGVIRVRKDIVVRFTSRWKPSE